MWLTFRPDLASLVGGAAVAALTVAWTQLGGLGREARRLIGEPASALTVDSRIRAEVRTSTAIGRRNMGELIDKAKGRVKQAAGKLTGSKKLEREGERDELKGKVEGVVERVKREVKDTLE